MPRPYNPLSYGDPTQIAAARAPLPPHPPAVADHVARPARLAPDALLSLSEFASLVRRHPRTVRGWVKDGLVRCVRIGRAKFIPECEFAKYIAGFREGYEFDNVNIESNTDQLKASSTLIGILNRECFPEFPLPSDFNQR